MLLTRKEFRDQCLQRDNNLCIICKQPATEVHHLIERKLFPDGGYYLDNGVSLCNPCHIKAETTEFQVQPLRDLAGIKRKVIPPGFPDVSYDKWGNEILPDGTRLRGELFYEESVQKILGKFLHEFSPYVKYPKTYHLPWSEGITSEDKVLNSLDGFIDKRIIVTQKMDGENTTMYSDHIHARSIDSSNHASRSWVKGFWSERKYDIPKGWRICGENLYAKHSIHYTNLPSYFMGFSIWNEKNECLSWDETLEYFKYLYIEPVTLWADIPPKIDVNRLKTFWNPEYDPYIEGYVVRIADSFSYQDFKNVVGKFVRKNHVTTSNHWMQGKIERNQLKENA